MTPPMPPATIFPDTVESTGEVRVVTVNLQNIPILQGLSPETMAQVERALIAKGGRAMP